MLHETSRTYLFPNGEDVIVDNVRKLQVSESGGHRITTKGGGMVYIPPTWIAIDIHSTRGWEQ